MGISGAAIATLVANVVGLIYMFVLGQHYFHVQYDGRKVLILVSAAVLSIVPAVVADLRVPQWRPELLGLKAALMLVPIGALFVSGVLTPASVAAMGSELVRRSTVSRRRGP